MICCWLALALLTIVCICLYKISKSNQKFEGENLTKYCPVCGKLIDDELDVCPYCGHIFDREKFDVISVYEPSSATDYTTEYTVISDAFEDDIDGKKKEDELLKEELLDKEWLSYFVDWEYLDFKDGEYSLTDRGKKALIRNRAKKKKKSGEN